MPDRPTIVLDPRRRFGEPILNNSGPEVEWLVDAYYYDDPSTLADHLDAYRLGADALFHACWYAAVYLPDYRTVWAGWLSWLHDNWQQTMWPDSLPDDVRWPPKKITPTVKRRRRRVMAGAR